MDIEENDRDQMDLLLHENHEFKRKGKEKENGKDGVNGISKLDGSIDGNDHYQDDGDGESAGDHLEGNEQNEGKGKLKVRATRPKYRKETTLQNEEIIRLMLQTMTDLGYKQSVQNLQSESGLQLEDSDVTVFRSAVLSGDWKLAEDTLPNLEFQSPSDFQKASLLIKEQKYLELLESRELKIALLVLRNEIAPISQDSVKVNKLASLIMCSSSEFQKKAQRNGNSREILLSNLQKLIHPSVMLPKARLPTLLMQAVKYQQSCYDHQNMPFSLFQDFACGVSTPNEKNPIILQGHEDEVWYAEFSHNGKFLASASKDFSAIIWSVDTGKPIYYLEEHHEPVVYLSWSPNDTMLLTCSRDKKIKLWNTQTGEIIRTFSKHTEEVVGCAWLPDGRRFLSGSPDKTLILWSIDGTELRSWAAPRIFVLTITHSGSHALLASKETIHFYNINGDEEDILQESGIVTSLSISKDDKYCLLNVGKSELHIWDIEKKSLVQRFSGNSQGTVIIRSCFAGKDEAYIASGSEDYNINIWDRERGGLIATLKGHNGIVNSVCSCSIYPFRLASASDDKTIKLWTLPILNT